MTINAKSKASAKYNKINTVRVALTLNKSTDADIISHLSTVDNKMGYIKQLIRADMNKH